MDLKKSFISVTVAGVIAVFAMYFTAVATGVSFELADLGMDIPVFMFAAFPLGAALVAYLITKQLSKKGNPRKQMVITSWVVLLVMMVPIQGIVGDAAKIWLVAIHFAFAIPIMLLFYRMPKNS